MVDHEARKQAAGRTARAWRGGSYLAQQPDPYGGEVGSSCVLQWLGCQPWTSHAPCGPGWYIDHCTGQHLYMHLLLSF